MSPIRVLLLYVMGACQVWQLFLCSVCWKIFRELISRGCLNQWVAWGTSNRLRMLKESWGMRQPGAWGKLSCSQGSDGHTHMQGFARPEGPPLAQEALEHPKHSSPVALRLWESRQAKGSAITSAWVSLPALRTLSTCGETYWFQVGESLSCY